MSPPASSLSVSLTPDQQAVFENQAVKASKELVKFSQLDHKFIAQLSSQANNNTTVETCMSDGAVCARIVVQATLSEIAKLYLPTDHASFQEYSQRLYPGTVIEAQHVQTLRASRKRQLTAIRWTAWHVAPIVQPRDFVVLEHNHDCSYRGQKGWVQSQHSLPSIQSPHFPEYVRGNVVRAGVVCLEGALPPWLGRLAATKFAQSIQNLPHRVDEARLSALDLALPERSLPSLGETTCGRCQKHCRAPREHCRKCGFIACIDCSAVYSLRVEQGVDFHVRLCRHCVQTCTSATNKKEDCDESYAVMKTTSSIFRPSRGCGYPIAEPSMPVRASQPFKRYVLL
ncbi:hypothetical protein AeMF1_003840 [Aphanomyces euteiches]|nr:hypothetical protein AeMF1_003840 [Aphanomyces euteiches]KAH9187489.1 hypothetical protein AeNC1_010534 [Aphanomyces euteiches]